MTMKFADLPIRRKLLAMALVITAIVLLASCAILVAFDLVTLRRELTREVGTLSEIIAQNSSAALAFNAREDGADLLRTLAAERSVVSAGLYTGSGELFASFGDPAIRPPHLAPGGGPSHEFRDGKLYTFRPVVENGRRLGGLLVCTDLRWWYQRLWMYVAVSLGLVGLAFLASVVFSTFLRKSITRPIEELSRIARRVSEKGDFSVRARRLGNDELGELTDTFNRMLAQIQHLNGDLEMRVAQRTAELEDSNRNLEAFAYSVSHDLRAPLRIISGYAEVLIEDRGEDLPEDQRMCLSRIVEGARKMNRLIDDLLHFSRLGKQPLKMEHTALDRLVDDVLVDLEREIGQRRIEWRRPVLPEVDCDPGLMRQVLSNLLSNALKYSRPRDPAIVEIDHRETQRELIFFVRDNGVGFDSAGSTRLFGVFQRLHSAQEFEGNGVGLATAARIIRRHGGRIWADSKPDEGATFYFTLPRSNTAAPLTLAGAEEAGH